MGCISLAALTISMQLEGNIGVALIFAWAIP
jgi:hypothetical protein